MRTHRLWPILLLCGCTAMVTRSPYGNEAGAPGSPPINHATNTEMWILAQLRNRDTLGYYRVGAPERASCTIRNEVAFDGWRVPVNYGIRRSSDLRSDERTLYAWYTGNDLRRVSLEPDYCPATRIRPG